MIDVCSCCLEDFHNGCHHQVSIGEDTPCGLATVHSCPFMIFPMTSVEL